ncbi:MAG TPA: hypothetical protein VND21_05445 [Planctomycetota bacterium]|nr:hypothetical protein [Planctomycetota bacterium]
MARPSLPTYEAFAARAREITTSIPARFLEGVEDVVVHRERLAHPLIDDVVTLGECEPSALVAITGGDTVHSIVHLYYGSFADLAAQDPRFDVDGELEETIRHEIQHHLEDRAGIRALIDEDDLADALHRFQAGLENPTGWWRRGARLERGVWSVENDLFLELRLRPPEFEARRGTTIELTVLDEPFEAEIPEDAEPGEILTYEGAGLPSDEDDHGHRHGSKREAKRAAPSDEDDDEDAPPAGDLHLVLDVGPAKRA